MSELKRRWTFLSLGVMWGLRDHFESLDISYISEATLFKVNEISMTKHSKFKSTYYF